MTGQLGPSLSSLKLARVIREGAIAAKEDKDFADALLAALGGEKGGAS